jgi:hypothetical protein
MAEFVIGGIIPTFRLPMPSSKANGMGISAYVGAGELSDGVLESFEVMTFSAEPHRLQRHQPEQWR